MNASLLKKIFSLDTLGAAFVLALDFAAGTIKNPLSAETARIEKIAGLVQAALDRLAARLAELRDQRFQ